jgi:hypothetical protein
LITRIAAAVAFAVLLTAMAPPVAAQSDMPQLPPQPKVHPAGIPGDFVLVSPCIAGMGEHWANLKNPPLGPIYGTWEGKPIFTEIMVTVKQLTEGFAYANIRALPGYTIDHVDFRYEPNGHAGLPVPHYDLHAYYVSPDVQKTICPNGVPDPSMRAPNE